MTVNTVTEKSPKGGCRGCLPKLLIPVVLLALCGGCLLLSPLLLRAAGFLPLSAEELYAGAPDPVAGALVDNILAASGIEGSKSYVLPIKGRNKQLAVVTLGDATRFKGAEDGGDVGAIMRTIAALATINETGIDIERTVVALRDKDSKLLLAITVDQADLEAFARGETTRAEFLAKVDADLSGLLDVNRLQTLASSAEFEGLPEIGQADAEFVSGAAVEWAVGKNLVTVNCPPPYDAPACAPSVNVAEVARFQASQNDLLGFGLGLVGARSVNQEADTALGAARVAAALAEADTLAEEGLAERDAGKFERALSLRPGDWSLRDKQAAFLHAQGDSGAAERSLKEAEKLVDDQIQAGGDCLMLRQNQFRNRAVAFGRAAELNPGNQSIEDELAQTQLTLAALDSGQDAGLCR